MIRGVSIFASLVLFAANAPAALEQERFLDAVRQVENWDGRDGRHGERGPYQLTASVWEMHEPGRPFAMARQEAAGRACALKHVAWLQAGLSRAGIDPSPFNVALAYNAGRGAVLRGRAPERAYDYAGRVRNLYQSIGASGQNTLNRPAATRSRWKPGVGFITGAPFVNLSISGALNGRAGTPSMEPRSARVMSAFCPLWRARGMCSPSIHQRADRLNFTN